MPNAPTRMPSWSNGFHSTTPISQSMKRSCCNAIPITGTSETGVGRRGPVVATIPIMMSTSKEGDLYLSQARALGALGILPKDVKPTALFEVLRELGLVVEPEQVVSPSMVESTPEHIHDNEFDAERFARDMARQTAVMVESALRTSAREIVQEQLVEFRSGALWTS